MHAAARLRATAALHGSRAPAVLAVAALVVLLAVLPAASADASPDASPAALPAGGLTALAPAGLDGLLEEVPLNETTIPVGTLEVPRLAKLIAELPGISQLSGVKHVGGRAGLEEKIVKAIKELLTEEEQLEELVGGFGLEVLLEERLEPAEEAVEKELGRSLEEVLDEGLESLTLSELLSRLLGQAAHPTVLADRLLGAIEPEELEELLGTQLSGEAFTRMDVAEVAAETGESSAQLAEKLGQTPTELPAAAIALIKPLANGQVLAVFGGTKGLAYGLVGTRPVTSEPEEPEEPAGGSSGPGNGTGTPESPAGNGTLTSSTATSFTPAPASALPLITTAPPVLGRVKILSHRINGASVTIVLELPAAGRLTVRGSNLAGISRTATRAGRLSIRVTTSKAGATSLRKRHLLKVKLQVSFMPARGTPSSAALAVALR
jgi:hypothetical protein